MCAVCCSYSSHKITHQPPPTLVGEVNEGFAAALRTCLPGERCRITLTGPYAGATASGHPSLLALTAPVDEDTERAKMIARLPPHLRPPPGARGSGASDARETLDAVVYEAAIVAVYTGETVHEADQVGSARPDGIAELVASAQAAKLRGTALLKDGDFGRAYNCYRRGLSHLRRARRAQRRRHGSNDDGVTVDSLPGGARLEVALHLNAALASLKLGDAAKAAMASAGCVS